MVHYSTLFNRSHTEIYCGIRHGEIVVQCEESAKDGKKILRLSSNADVIGVIGFNDADIYYFQNYMCKYWDSIQEAVEESLNANI
jgi:hypothetical protein